MSHLLFFSEERTPRLRYIVRFILGDILGLEYEFTGDKAHFTNCEGPKINYSKDPSLGGIHIFPRDLLFENNIHPLVPEFLTHEKFPLLFAAPPGAFFPFDLFSASFYLVSRYEEYLPFEPDKHGRFEAQESLAFRHGFLHRPVVDEWTFFLRDEMVRKWPSLVLKSQTFRFLTTIDVDNAWAYSHKNALRCFGSAVRDCLQGRPNLIINRIKVLTGKEIDPFDNFDWIIDINKFYNFKPVWFFLCGRYGKFDRNISPGHPAMRELIKKCATQGDIGIHPSYGSHLNPGELSREISILSTVSEISIGKSRQHYLRVRFPETYRNLIKAGILQDYSLGYASQPGFRAGTCTPFRFYDLEDERETDLNVHSFQVMDRTYMDYLQLSPVEACRRIISLAALVKKYGDEFISIFHNETLGPDSEGEDWRCVYKDLLQTIRNWE